jgi:hypothetical protein
LAFNINPEGVAAVLPDTPSKNQQVTESPDRRSPELNFGSMSLIEHQSKRPGSDAGPFFFFAR